MDEIEKAALERTPGEKLKEEPDSNDNDELLPQAVDVICETGQASVSMLQRRLKLGYSRAARIVDQMEQIGIVGPFEGSKPRAVLVTRDQWRQMQYVSGKAPEDKIYPDPDALNSDTNDEV
jgi:S-DNA-T family DNA segregation ATPase FtsK/SpoIIIE